MSPPRRRSVALVMPVRNEAESVFMTLDSLYSGTRIPDEVIVADGRSTDATREEVARWAAERGRPEVRVVDNPAIWCGGGRNAGIRASSSELLIFADFGNAFEPDFIEEMVRPFEERPEVDLVAGLFRPMPTSEFEHCAAAIHYFEDYRIDDYAPDQLEALLPEMVAPGGMAFGASRAACERMGDFPEWLFKGQDKLFGRKARALGAEVAVAWRAFVRHHVRGSPRALWRQLHLYGRGFGQQRYLNRMAVKLTALYAAVLALLGLGLAHPAFAAIGLLLFMAHYWRGFLRRLLALRDKRRPRPIHLWHGLTALLARDLGAITGAAAGWWDWFTKREFRDRFQAYMVGCARERVTLVAR